MTTRTTMSAVTSTATVDQWVFRIAGMFVLASIALSQLHTIHWLWFTAFVGANMLQASFTGFCPLAKILGRLGVRDGAAFHVAGRAG
jgi:Protein of unknown function (DUF2892)